MSSLPARTDYSGTPSNATARARDVSAFDFLAQRMAAGTSGAGTATDAELKTSRDSLAVPMPNILHNSDGAIYQRVPGSTADDVYAADRWYALTQTSTVTSAQISNPEDGYRYGLRLTQSQVTAQRLGYAQIVEGGDTSSLRGKTVTFGGRFKLSAAQTLRFAILAWTGAENVVTSDVVNSWTNATFTPGNFFNATTLSLVGTGSTALSAGTATTCSVSGTVPSGATNLVVMFWTEAAAAQNVTLDGWGLRLVDAASLVTVIDRSVGDQLQMCQRYFYASAEHALFFSGDVTSGATYFCTGQYPVTMRIAPTVVNLFNSAATSFPSTASTVGVATTTGIYGSRAANATGAGSFSDRYNASADL